MEILRDSEFCTPGLLSDPQRGMLAFIEDPVFLPSVLKTAGIACVIADPSIASSLDAIPGVALSKRPRYTFFKIHEHLAKTADVYWTDFATTIHGSAKIHSRAYVAEKNVRIGPATVVGPNACVHERCLIGSSVEIGSGSVLGSEGFQTCRSGEETIDMVHAGGIRVGDRVRIFSGAVVARAIFGQFTTLGEGSRVGNLAFVSHNVQLGRDCLVGHGSVINGNVVVGVEATIGPGATLAHSIRIGDRAEVTIGSSVISDVPAGRRVTGNVATDHQRYLRMISSLK